MLRKGKLQRILCSATLAVAMMMAVMTLLGMDAYAQDQRPEYIGTEQLGIGVNTPSAKVVKFGGKSWYVIGYDGNGVASGSGEIVLLMKNSLQSSPYSTRNNPKTGDKDDPTYKGSTLQTLLDTYANENFTDGEKQTVIPRELAAMNVDEHDYLWWDDYFDTVDEVPYEGVTASAWPLSAKEATDLNADIRKINESYWLRSLSTVDGPDWDTEEYWTGYLMSIVWPDGGVESQRWQEDLSVSKGVRPAIKLKKDNILYLTPADNGEWKLTLKDEAHKNFSVDTCDNTLDSNGDLVIKYQNAVPGDNEYIKYVIKGSDGSIKNYTQCDKVTAASGAATLTGLPKDSEGKISLSEGDKLYVFNEQDNGNNTNLASNLIELGTTTGHDWVFFGLFHYEHPQKTRAEYYCSRDPYHKVIIDAEYEKRIVAPTCEEKGKIIGVSSISAENSPDGKAHSKSEDLVNTGDALGHDYSNYLGFTWNDKDADYTGTALRLSCSHDGSHIITIQSDPIAKEVVDPTCTAPGYTEYTAKATYNGKTYTDTKRGNSTSKLGHDWGEPTYTWSDDNSSVTATRVCKRDPSHVETETVETTMSITTQPTCKATGRADFTTKPFTNNAFTEQTKTDQEIPADPEAHAWNDGEEIAPHGCGGVVMLYKCTLCDNGEKTEIVGGDSHDFEEGWTVFVEPTCTESGDRFHKCSKCGAFDLEHPDVLEPLGHQWKFVNFTWTGNETDGYEKAVANYVCEHDSSHKMTVDAAIADEVIDPTCEEGGKTVYTASVSASDSPDEAEHRESKDAKITETIGHKWHFKDVLWTGNEEAGFTKAEVKFVCENVESHEKLVDANITEKVIEPTCAEPGYTWYRASLEAKDSLTGYEVYDNNVAKIKDAKGHDWKEWEYLNDAQHQRVCKHAESHNEKAEHSWDNGKVTKEATEAEEGEKTYTCTVCKGTKTETIPKLDPTPYSVPSATAVSAATATVNNATASAAAIRQAIQAAGGNADTLVLGKKVKRISKRVLAGTGIKTIVVESKKLKKKSVKGSLKGSSVTTVKVNVGKAKTNKKYVKKYKKIFTKKNAGKKVKVKR